MIEDRCIQPLQASKPSVFCHLVCVCRRKIQRSGPSQSPQSSFSTGSICISSVLVQTRAGWALSYLGYVYSGSSVRNILFHLQLWSQTGATGTFTQLPLRLSLPLDTNTPTSSGLLSTVVEKLPGLTWQNLTLQNLSVWIPLAVEWRGNRDS